jgi:hypothetical protein
MKKKRWWPPPLYEAKPWIALGLGALFAVGTFVASFLEGTWDNPFFFLFPVGCGLLVYGAVILQLRREYRRSSKWARQSERSGQ